MIQIYFSLNERKHFLGLCINVRTHSSVQNSLHVGIAQFVWFIVISFLNICMHLPQREDTNAPEHKTSRCTAVEETNQLHNFKQEKNSCLEAKKTRRGFHKLDHPTEDRNGADGSYHLTLDTTRTKCDRGSRLSVQLDLHASIRNSN
jgi:hypothetical protein